MTLKKILTKKENDCKVWLRFLNCCTFFIVLSTDRYQIIYLKLLSLAEQINLVPFCYVHQVYQKNQLGTRLDKRHIISEKKKLNQQKRKNKQSWGSWGFFEPSAEVLGGVVPKKSFLDRFKCGWNNYCSRL